MMESKVNYTVVGSFVLILTAVVIFLVIWLSGKSSSRQYTTYLVLMNESVNGLSVNSAVKYNGVTVGNVKDISLNAHNPNQVRLLLDIDADTPVKVDTRATLMSQGLTGLSFVNLTGGSPNAPLLKTEQDEVYPVIQTEASFMLRLDNAVRQLSINITDLSTDIRELLDKDNRLAVKNTLKNLYTVTAALAANARQIDESVKSTHLILKNTAEASERFPVLINNLNNASINVIEVTKKLDKASVATTAAMQDAHTFMQTISNQALPQALQTLNSLHSVSAQIKDLTMDLRQNPSMLIRGRQPLKPGPGE